MKTQITAPTTFRFPTRGCAPPPSRSRKSEYVLPPGALYGTEKLAYINARLLFLASKFAPPRCMHLESINRQSPKPSSAGTGGANPAAVNKDSRVSSSLLFALSAACAALRHPLDPDAVDIEVDGGSGGDGNEALQNAKDARFRALPRRWLARWRAFAFAKGVDKHSTGASPAWRPSLESLREAVEELFCPHGGLVAACDLRGSVSRKRSGEEKTEADASLAALEAERTRALRAVFGDGASTITSTRKTQTNPNGDGRTHASTLPVADSLEGGVQTVLRPNANRRGRVLSLELVPASALAALEEVLGGRVDLAPRCFAAPASASDGLGRTFAPATCAAWRVSRANAKAECRGEESDGSWLASSNERPFVEPYFSASISVRRVKSDPAAFAKAFADRAKAIGAKRRVLDADLLDADADRGGFRREESLAAEKKKDHAPANRDNATTRRGRVVKAPSDVGEKKRSEKFTRK